MKRTWKSEGKGLDGRQKKTGFVGRVEVSKSKMNFNFIRQFAPVCDFGSRIF